MIMKIKLAVLIILLAVLAMPAVAVHQRDFVFEKWGAYNFEDSSGKRYFAGYVQEPTLGMEGSLTPFLWEISNDKSLMEKGLASEVLIDQSEEGTISKSMPLNLSEGYQLHIMSFDTVSEKAFLELTRYGETVDSKMLSTKFGAPMDETTYYYRTDLGSAKDIVQIAVHFKNIFAAADIILGTYDGIFQVSSSPTSNALLDGMSQSATQTNIVNGVEGVDPSDALGWYYKGRDLFLLGKYEEALKAYDKSIELDPNLGGVWWDKYYTLQYLHRSPEANAVMDTIKSQKIKDTRRDLDKGITNS
jgi:tetratricopeptide (TPR) repeat protein